MRRHTLFTRLLTVSLAVILICVGVLSVLSYVYLRETAIQSRMNALKTQARDMAYLSSRLSSDSVARAFGKNSTTEAYMRWKSNRIYSEYNAYIMVVDRSGKVSLYYNESTLQDESIQAMPDADSISTFMDLALKGEEVVRQTQSAAGPLFTVLVPWVQDNSYTNTRTVMGFVLIQTAAQTVHASYSGLIWQTVIAALIIFLLAAGLLFFITRQLTRPLTAMAQAAGRMARGDFNARAPEEGSREIVALSQSFNQMAAQLADLEQSRRDFVANVSHELRSPITSIQGFAQGMLDGTIPQEEHPQYLQVVVDETHRLSKLINGLLNLSRMENEETSLAYTDFDVNELTRRVLISRLTQIDEKQLEIEADLGDDPCYVHADADQIQQVIINLLDNAIKFTPKGGTITLTTRTEGDTAYLRVKDTGVGILPQDAPHIFDRFYKADKAHTVGKGTGLGLAICHRIMEKHGQSIRLISGDHGAEFEITLAKGKPHASAYANPGPGEN
ncbi:MAG: HAMP domain-containing histidine kinase [Clostridia bacterium]|nr:HAMP domain-containing histidine kinase [Clostridia bacterium]